MNDEWPRRVLGTYLLDGKPAEFWVNEFRSFCRLSEIEINEASLIIQEKPFKDQPAIWIEARGKNAR